MGSKRPANFIIAGSQCNDVSLSRYIKCIKSYGLWLGTAKSFVIENFVAVGFHYHYFIIEELDCSTSKRIRLFKVVFMPFGRP